MKIRTIRHIIKAGIVNLSKNKLMSFAAISIVVASLTIFGIFYLLIINFNHNLANLQEQPEMQIFCYADLDEVAVNIVENTLNSNENIKDIMRVSKEEAFEKVKDMLGEDFDLLEGMDNDFLPVSFILKLHNPENCQMIVEELERITGVEKINYPQKAVDFISKFAAWVQLISSFLILVLLIVSIFIISNTIRLTVVARKREIGIMKCIGATDWFIRWPFIVEGVIIGVLGGLLAFSIIAYGYNLLVAKFTEELSRLGNGIIELVELKSMGIRTFLFYPLLGLLVGTIGSAISIRKYLKV